MHVSVENDHKGAEADIEADEVSHIVQHQLCRILLPDNSLYPTQKDHIYDDKDGV